MTGHYRTGWFTQPYLLERSPTGHGVNIVSFPVEDTNDDWRFCIQKEITQVEESTYSGKSTVSVPALTFAVRLENVACIHDVTMGGVFGGNNASLFCFLHKEWNQNQVTLLVNQAPTGTHLRLPKHQSGLYGLELHELALYPTLPNSFLDFTLTTATKTEPVVATVLSYNMYCPAAGCLRVVSG